MITILGNCKYRIVIALLFNLVFIVSCASSPQPDATAKKVESVSKHTNKTSPRHKGQDIAALAKSMLGTPYRYGGSSPNGFDCSGLVYYTHGKLGIKVPRTSNKQFNFAKPIKINRLQVGDVVFFRLNKKNISHIGIYIGNNRFIHAPVSGKKVSINYLNEPYWKSKIAGGGRLY